MNSKQILFSFDYPPNDGGIARLCENIAIALAKKSIPITVLTQESDVSAAVDASVNTVRVTTKRPQREWHAYKYLKSLHSHAIYISGIWYPEGLIVALSRKKPHVVFALGAELFPPPQLWRHWLWKRLQRYTLENASMVVAISKYTAMLVRETAPSAKIVTVPLAVDHIFFSEQNRQDTRQKWQIGQDKRVVLTVARVNAYKGYETVFQALARLTPQIRQQFVYLIAGKGPDVEVLQDKARALGVDDVVQWLGFVPEEDLPSLYSAADLFVLLTREIKTQQAVEGFGLVFLEAQACGTPVVGTNSGGIPDAVSHEDGGWLIEQDNPNALAEILLKLIDHPNSFREMGQRARIRVEREFTWNHYMKRFKEALRSGGIELD